jgi:homopolymeric O-antigen transport system permease protein
MITQLVADVREIVSEQRQYTELLYQLTKRDLLLRYKQTAMGFGWAVFMPLLNTAIFSVIFVRVAPIETAVPYPLFAYTGLLAWNFFASSLRFGVTSLTSNASLVTKVYFPREALPISAVLVTLVDFAVGALVLIPLMLYYHVAPGPAILLLPVVVLVHVAFTVGVTLFLSMANLFYRDVKYLIEIVVSIWMFATSVVYPVERVGGRLGAVLALNPMTPIIDAYRAVVVYNQPPDPGSFWPAAVAAFIVLFAGWLVFHRAEFQFAENV